MTIFNRVNFFVKARNTQKNKRKRNDLEEMKRRTLLKRRIIIFWGVEGRNEVAAGKMGDERTGIRTVDEKIVGEVRRTEGEEGGTYG